MKRSKDRILTTHVGSLPRPEDLIPLLQAKDSNEPYDPKALDQRVTEAVKEVAKRQSALGIHVRNDYYKTQEEYRYALADAMRTEYKAITDAGIVLQLDDPLLATHWNNNPDISMDECRKFIAAQVEVINYALRDIPPERVRFHTC